MRRKTIFLICCVLVLLAGVLIAGICFFLPTADGQTTEQKSWEQPPLPDEETADEGEDPADEEDAGGSKEPLTQKTDVPDEEPAEAEPTKEELLQEQVDGFLAKMTLSEKVLQMFLITPEALTGQDPVTVAGEVTKASIEQSPVGGIIYFAKNLKNPEQTKEMLANTRKYYADAGYAPPFLAVDEEGGSVARIANEPAFGVEQVGDMQAIGAGGDPSEAERVGNVIGTYLSELGFNLDFAPDADVLTNPDGKVIGKRSFGTDASLVADMALAEAKALEAHGVHATLKHYPGHGAVAEDTHEGFAYTDKSLEELLQAELVPFAAGAKEGVSFIMAAHISVPQITGDDTPCSLSPYMITDVLRGQLGYNGIIVTDAMNMGAVRDRYDSAQAAVAAIQAGADIVLMPDDFAAAYEGVLAAVQNGDLSEERIDESVRRILRVKLK